MAIPTLTTTLNNLATLTVHHTIPKLVDNIYGSNPLFARLMQRGNVTLDGGLDIRQPIVYKKGKASSYGKGGTFDTSLNENKTNLVFDWKRYYSPITLDKVEALLNQGARAVIDEVAAELEIARLDLENQLGEDLFGDGTGNGGLVINGLNDICDDSTNTASYGKITYSSTTGDPGLAIKSNLDSTGGAFSLSMVQTQYGNATVGAEKPDLIITTQSIWDSFWARVQPAQRYNMTGVAAEMADIGFNVINYNGAAVIADSHCPSGVIYGLNTAHLFMVVHRDRNIVFEGWKEFANQDQMTGQILWLGNLVCDAPRLQFKIESVT